VILRVIEDAYNRHIKSQNVTLVSKNPSGTGGVWRFFGRGDITSKYWARVYEVDAKFQKNITEFRREIYTFITSSTSGIMRKPRVQKINPTDPSDVDYYDMYSTVNGELYAIHSDHYTDVKNWRPHISILKIDELKTNPNYGDIIDKKYTDDDRTDGFIGLIGKVNPISNINFGGPAKNVDELLISLRTVPFLSKIKTPVKDIDAHIPV